MQGSLLKPTDHFHRVERPARPSKDPLVVGRPRTHFEHSICLFPDAVSKAQGIQDFQSSRLQAIDLAGINLPMSFVHGANRIREGVEFGIVTWTQVS